MNHPTENPAHGTALVIVLAMLVLLLGLVLAFFSSVTSDSSSSNAYAAGVSVQKLSDTAANLAAAQIQYATQGKDTASNDIAWSSQPGAIRTYTAAGGEGNVFKLYSAQNMVAPAATFKADLAAEISANATASPALFTDLNEPVLTGDTGGSITLSGVKYRANYPIFDPAALGQINGLSIGGSTTPPAAGYNPVAAGNPAPMPVRWLYVLQDGSVVNPTGTGSVATVPGANPTSNPIVGRVAFWTDDETSKVNINTAGEISAWDTPRFQGVTEQNFGSFQPANNEFQRYPGHPSTVSLSEVFPSVSDLNLFYQLAPRLQTGGSQRGTVAATAALPIKQDRLFATIDELNYRPDRTANVAGLTRDQIERATFVLTANSRAPETTLFDTPRISMWPIHADLASNSASPFTTSFDKLSAFCSTLGNGLRFHFQRRTSTSNNEINGIPRNLQLIQYLQNLTQRNIPGFGGNFNTKYGADRDQILAQIFDYVRMTNPADDNLGGAETSATGYSSSGTRYTYTPGRSGVSGYRPGFGQVAPTVLSSNARGIGRIDTLSEAVLHLICTADGSLPAVPGSPTATEAIVSSSAKKETISQMQPFLTSLANSRGTPANQPVLQPNERVLQMAFYIEMTNVAQNWDGVMPNYSIEVSGLPSLSVTGASPANPFPAGSNTTSVMPARGWWHQRLFGTVNSHRSMLVYRLPAGHANNPTYSGDPAVGRDVSSGVYPFVSAPFVITVPPSGQIDLSALTLTLKVLSAGSPAQTLQTYTLEFPVMTVPVPKLETAGVDPLSNPAYSINLPALSAKDWWGFRSRFAFARDNPGAAYPSASDPQWHGCVIRREFDVVRSLVPRWGDNRLTAGIATVPSSYFVLHPLTTSTVRIANSLTEGGGSHYTPNTDSGAYDANTDLRRLVSGARYVSRARPDLPPDAAVTAKAEATGDWDNGLALGQDGSWINKPDEGNNAAGIPYFTSPENITGAGATFFSPNRIIPSPGMLGSLPSRVRASLAAEGTPANMRPWETLLFRPQTGHPGASSPPDHLWMDLFWMPTVEPYAISEPFSTAGKVNLNYQIVPFTNIRRTTALRSAMKNELLAAVPTADGDRYKGDGPTPGVYRFPLNLDEVTGSLRQFEEKFAVSDLFRSASEICNIYLVPTGQSWSNDAAAESYWTTRKLTGDNSRERPYTNLYGKLTTKSNSYTVHYRVQLLKQPPNSTAGQWDETKGKVQAEFRGSRQIERYVEPRDAALPDFATTPTAKLSDYYRLRLLNDRRFSP